MNEQEKYDEFYKKCKKHGVVAITSGSYYLEHGKEMPIDSKLAILNHIVDNQIIKELDKQINDN